MLCDSSTLNREKILQEITDLILGYVTAPAAVQTEGSAHVCAAPAASTDTQGTTPEIFLVSWQKFQSPHAKVWEPTAEGVTGFEI